jgi:hypothetical protein
MSARQCKPMIDTLHPASNTGIAAMINTVQLVTFITLLESKGIEYALVGGAALLTMDDCKRPTDDFDFIVSRRDIDQLEELTQQSSDRNFGRYLYQGTQIDALYRDNPIFEYVMDNYLDSAVVEGKEIVRASPTGIILLKLYALPSLYQQGQQRRAMIYENDISALLIQGIAVDFDAILKALTGELLPSQIQELSNILEDCQRRANRQRFS